MLSKKQLDELFGEYTGRHNFPSLHVAPKVMIIGHGRHGKDTVAALLVDALKLRFMASSEICSAVFIFDALKDEFGYTTPQECFEDRSNHRELWHQLISVFNFHDKAALIKLIYQYVDVYVGCRCVKELTGAKEAGEIDVTIWVDAIGRVPIDDEPSFSVHKGLAEYHIDNSADDPDQVILTELVNELALVIMDDFIIKQN